MNILNILVAVFRNATEKWWEYFKRYISMNSVYPTHFNIQLRQKLLMKYFTFFKDIMPSKSSVEFTLWHTWVWSVYTVWHRSYGLPGKWVHKMTGLPCIMVLQSVMKPRESRQYFISCESPFKIVQFRRFGEGCFRNLGISMWSVDGLLPSGLRNSIRHRTCKNKNLEYAFSISQDTLSILLLR